jgi:hypothetical protein
MGERGSQWQGLLDMVWLESFDFFLQPKGRDWVCTSTVAFGRWTPTTSRPRAAARSQDCPLQERFVGRALWDGLWAASFVGEPSFVHVGCKFLHTQWV